MRIAKVAVVLGLTSLIACSGEPDPVEKAEPIRDGSRLDDIDSLSSPIVQIIGIGIGGPPTPEPQIQQDMGSGMLVAPRVVIATGHQTEHFTPSNLRVRHAPGGADPRQVAKGAFTKTVKVRTRFLTGNYDLQEEPFLSFLRARPPSPHRVDLSILILEEAILPTGGFPDISCVAQPTRVEVHSAIWHEPKPGPNASILSTLPNANQAQFDVTSIVFNPFTTDFAPNGSGGVVSQAVRKGDSGSGILDFSTGNYIGVMKSGGAMPPQPSDPLGIFKSKPPVNPLAFNHGQFTRLTPALCRLIRPYLPFINPGALEAGSALSFLQQVDKDLQEDVVSLTPIAGDTAALTIDRTQLGVQTFETSIPEAAELSGGALGNFDGKGQALALIQDGGLTTASLIGGPKPAISGAPSTQYVSTIKVRINGDAIDDLVAQRLSGEIDVFTGSTNGLVFNADIHPFSLRLDKDTLQDFVWLDGQARIHTASTLFGHFSQEVIPNTIDLDAGKAGRFRALVGENAGIQDFVTLGVGQVIWCNSTTFGGFVCHPALDAPSESGRVAIDIDVQDLTDDGLDDVTIAYSNAEPRVILAMLHPTCSPCSALPGYRWCLFSRVTCGACSAHG